MTVKVDELSFHSPAGGKFSTALAMAGDDITAKLDLDHFDTGPYVPAGLKKLAAGKAHGHMRIAANIGDKKSVALTEIDLGYQRAFRGNRVPGRVRITGPAQASPESASTKGLRIAIPGAQADVRGKVGLAKKVLDVGLRIGASDLPRVLSSLKVGPLAKSAEVAVDLTGSMDSPSADGRIEVRDIGGGSTGIPAVAELHTGFRLRDGILTVDGLHAGVAGGSLDGGGSATLFE